jgi:PAS domain S-box-containing protein
MDIATPERQKRPVVDQDVPFSFAELFFSRTNPKGIIRSGNSVFQRISMYPWNELIGKPHNIIRHPDMPRTVFWLLWDTIKKGEPIGAYVKNRAKDGRYYWVFAIVTPIEDGYLSVRLKPSALLSVIDAEYKALAAKMAQDKLEPKDGVPILLQRLAALGFNDYAAFMATALSREMAARDRQLGRPADRTLALFDSLVEQATSLLVRADAIFDAYTKIRLVPLNLTVRAKHLGAGGATIGVISNDYNAISAEIKASMDRFVASARQLLRAISEGQFLICVAKVQQEVAEYFRAEGDVGELDRDREMALLLQQQSAYQAKAVAGLRAIMAQAASFQQDCAEMKRLATGLEVTRIMGKMESSRLLAKDGLNELIDELGSFQSAIDDGLKDIDAANRSIQQSARKMIASGPGHLQP